VPSPYSQQPTELSTGVARFCDVLGQQSQWPLLTEITKLKRNQLFIEYPFVCLNNWKFVERKKSNFFSFKCSFSRPFNSAAHYSRKTPPPPSATPPGNVRYVTEWFSKTNLSSTSRSRMSSDPFPLSNTPILLDSITQAIFGKQNKLWKFSLRNLTLPMFLNPLKSKFSFPLPTVLLLRVTNSGWLFARFQSQLMNAPRLVHEVGVRTAGQSAK
jgi:hypothetical protein